MLARRVNFEVGRAIKTGKHDIDMWCGQKKIGSVSAGLPANVSRRGSRAPQFHQNRWGTQFTKHLGAELHSGWRTFRGLILLTPIGQYLPPMEIALREITRTNVRIFRVVAR